MPKLVITSNSSKISARYRRIAARMPNVITQTLQQLADGAIPMFDQTVATWSNKPTFQTSFTQRGVTVNTDDPRFGWVDRGTRPHVIEAKNAPLLRFQGPYHAKTKVNVISSYQGGRGKVWVAKKRVNHPGTEARNFSHIIFTRVQARAANTLRANLDEAIAGSGTGI